jgi:hypothetical protein
MPRTATKAPEAPQATEPTQPYDREALYDSNGPIDPRCVQDAIQTIMRTVQIDPDEPHAWTSRRMFCAMRALSALHPRDEIELMLGVQALSAYHVANAGWRLVTNPRHDQKGDPSRHIAKAASAARTFDSMLRALERRQAKPLSVPVGRPAPQVWPPVAVEPTFDDLKRRADMGEEQSIQDTIGPLDQLTDDELICAWIRTGRHRHPDENHGLDIANTEGILPNGGMISPANPTPQQTAYLARRQMLKYCRQKEADRRNGIDRKIVVAPLRDGDLVL